ncbi:O-antigen ligase family protein [Bacillus sp. N9]
MVVSIATSTSISSYDHTKIGYTGWFYAGNEIGAILAIISPIVLYNCIKSTTSIKQLYAWIPFLLMGFSL